MTTREAWLDGQPLHLRPRDLLQSGGEGLVFAHGPLALKHYHQPSLAHAARLALWFTRRRPQVPDNVLVPERPLHDRNGRTVGFAMRRLPHEALPLRKLAHSAFCLQQGFTLRDAAHILEHARITLVRLHAAGLIVGDLNDRNLFFSRQAGAWRTWWIDVDSYQIDDQPCPVAQLPFLDPRLYHVSDFASRPWFSQQSDWYAFHVLLFKGLLQVHPYGGTHPHHKTLQARALQQLPATEPGVLYPPNARPPALLQGALAAQMARVFAMGERPSLPGSWLADFLGAIRDCPTCGGAAPAAGPCPACAAPPRPNVVVRRGGLSVRPLLQLDRERLVAVDVDPATGRWQAVLFQPHSGHYALASGGRGGCRARRPLFSGGPGYGFRFTNHALLILGDSGDSTQILLQALDSGAQIALATTSRFDQQPVVATTRRAVYRQAGGYLLRGIISSGAMREGIAADARRRQTALGPAAADQVAGFYRVFDTFHPFAIDDGGALCDLRLPSPPTNQRLTRVNILRSGDGPALLLTYSQRGRAETVAALYDKQGGLAASFALTLAEPAAAVRRGAALFVPGGDGLARWEAGAVTRFPALAADVAGATLVAHPDGLLVAHPDRLLLVAP